MDNRLLSALSESTLYKFFVNHQKHITMKKVFLLAGLITGLAAFAAPDPSEKVLKAFNETFKSAKEITWHDYQDYMQANFKQDEIQVRAQYADDGTLIKTIRYYGETHLLPTIVAKLNKKYPGKEIFGVTETVCSEEVCFIINLKDENNWYIVKSDMYGNLTQTDKFKRADK